MWEEISMALRTGNGPFRSITEGLAFQEFGDHIGSSVLPCAHVVDGDNVRVIQSAEARASCSKRRSRSGSVTNP